MSEYTPSMEELREAWLSAEFEERDSTTSDDDLRAEFDRALAAHDAEVRAGVVPEEPEWEYGVRLHRIPPGRGTNLAAYTPLTTPHRTLESAERMAALNPLYQPTFHRRRKAGPWMPVEQGEGS